MRSFGWTLIQYGLYPYGKGKFRYRDTHTQRESYVKKHRENIATYKPRKEACNRFSQSSPGTTLLVPWYQMSSLQNCDKINFYYLRHPVMVLCHGIPIKWIQMQIHTFGHLSFQEKRTVRCTTWSSFLLGRVLLQVSPVGCDILAVSLWLVQDFCVEILLN